tara:strand:+ start:458 stop:958 length:501 start_codon:yes stop_codon:yes gene_type:complete
MQNANGTPKFWDRGVLERELVLTRVLDAPKALVFSAWINPEHLTSWFCPEGYTAHTHEIDVRVGGRWRFTYVSPEGIRYENRVVFLNIDPLNSIEFDHGPDEDDSATRFRVLITFEEQSNGKTVLSLRQLHPTKAQRDGGLGFGAVEIGFGTLNNLEKYLGTIANA